MNYQNYSGALAMKTFLILWMILTFDGNFLLAQPNNKTFDRGVSSVYGSVSEATGSGYVKGAIVTFTDSSGKVYVTETNDEGKYEIAVSPSIFDIKVWSRGFFQFRRSPLTVRRGERLSIDFVLLLYELNEIVRLDSEGNPAEKLCTCAKEPKNTTIYLDEATEEGSSLFIQYGFSDVANDDTFFKGIDISYGDCKRVTNDVFRGVIKRDKYLPVIISLGHITVSADEVLYKSKLKEIEITGNVIFEDGRKRVYPEKITVNTRNGAIELN